MEVQRGTRGQSDVHSWPAAATLGVTLGAGRTWLSPQQGDTTVWI